MTVLTATISEGEKVAKFDNGLAIQFNTAASQNYAVSVEPMSKRKWLSIQERKTIWMWCGEWAEQRGSSKDACMNEFKARFLFPEICNKPRHANVRQLITDIWNQVSPEIQCSAVGPHIRSAWANHEEYHAALTQFETWARTEASLILTVPDKYHAARKAAMETGKAQRVK